MYYSLKDLSGTLKRSFVYAIIIAVLVTGVYSVRALIQSADTPFYTSSGILYIDRQDDSKPNMVIDSGASTRAYQVARLVVTSEPVLAAVSKTEGINAADIAISSPSYMNDYYKTPLDIPLIAVEVKGSSPEQAYKAAMVATEKSKEILSEKFGYKQVTIYKMPVKDTLQSNNDSYISKISLKKLCLLFSLVFALVVFIFGVKEINSGKFYSADILETRMGLPVFSDLSVAKHKNTQRDFLKYKLNKFIAKTKPVYILDAKKAEGVQNFVDALAIREINVISGVLENLEKVDSIPAQAQVYLYVKSGKTLKTDIEKVVELLRFSDISLSGVIFC